MKFLRTLVHPNIIQVYGACSRPKIALVMELMENGSMHDCWSCAIFRTTRGYSAVENSPTISLLPFELCYVVHG